MKWIDSCIIVGPFKFQGHVFSKPVNLNSTSANILHVHRMRSVQYIYILTAKTVPGCIERKIIYICDLICDHLRTIETFFHIKTTDIKPCA